MRESILPCEALFGLERGAQIQAAVAEDTGQPCPCSQGRACPLMGFAPSVELEALAHSG